MRERLNVKRMKESENELTVFGTTRFVNEKVCVFIGGGGSTEIAIYDKEIKESVNTKVGVIDVMQEFPDLAEEWNFEKNGSARPNQFLPKSGKKVWWVCKTCGHEWETILRNRTNGHGCPICARKKRKSK